MDRLIAKLITPAEFFGLPDVVIQTNIQKRNRMKSGAHRNAHIEILRIAKMHGVDGHLESLDAYDA